MNIAILIIKNTAPLDFIFPILYEISETYPNIQCKVLYCDLSKYRYIRKSKYYTEKFHSFGIKEFDYISFLPKTNFIQREILRKMLSKSPKDSNHYSKQFKKLLSRMEEKLYSRISFSNIIGCLAPKVILLGNTESKNRPGVKEILENIYNERIQTFLLPHAPHHRNTEIFTPFFKERGWFLPEFCEYWKPFRFDHPENLFSEQKKQFYYVGYPGLDSRWLEKLKAIQPYRPNTKRRILFIIRRFTEKNSNIPNSVTTEDFIYGYQEVLAICLKIENVVKKTFADYEITVKPHPSNDYTSINKLIKTAKLRHWKITYEPIYNAIGKTDLIISMYSTTHLIPAMAGIPVIILASSIQSVAERDPYIKELYRGMQFALEDNEQLSEVIKKFNDNEVDKSIALDKNHIRRFYPDRAIYRGIERILLYLC